MIGRNTKKYLIQYPKKDANNILILNKDTVWVKPQVLLIVVTTDCAL